MQIINSQFIGMRHLRELPELPPKISWWYLAFSACMLFMIIACNSANLRLESFIFSFLFGLGIYSAVSYYLKVKSLEKEILLLARIKKVIETPVFQQINENIVIFTWVIAEIPDNCFVEVEKND